MERYISQDQLRKHTAFLWPQVDEYADRIFYIDANPGFTSYANKPNELVVSEANEAFDSGKDILIYFNMSDPIQVDAIVRVHAMLPGLKYSSENIYYLTLTSNCEECYRNICNEQGLTPTLKMVCLLSTMHEMQHYGSDYKPEFKIENKPKQFLCYNRVLRLHRIALLAKLLDEKLLDKGFYSLYGKTDAGWVDEPFVKNLDKVDVRLKFILRRDKAIIAQCRLDTDYDVRPNPIDLIKSDFHYFENSYYSLVTETVYYKDKIDPITQNSPFGHSITLTEKLFKPVAMKHPLIVVGAPKTLETFRLVGFKSYAPYINESYDTEEDDVKRMNMIIEEIQRLNNFTTDQWLEWQRGVQDIVEYNYNFLQQTKNYKIGPDLKV